MENYMNGNAIKAAINNPDDKPDTSRYTLIEFYTGTCSGEVDKREYQLGELDLEGRLQRSTQAIGGLLAAICFLEPGESVLIGAITTNLKGYSFRVTRVK